MNKLKAILFSLILGASFIGGRVFAEEFTGGIISDKSFFDPSVGLKEQSAAPSNVIPNYGQVYTKTDNLLYYQNDSGVDNLVLSTTGTLTDTKYCTYESATGINCNSEGGGGSSNLSVNYETLTGNKTLIAGTDDPVQYLDPNGSDRTITISNTASNGDEFYIINNGAWTDNEHLDMILGSSNAGDLYVGSTNHYVFTGSGWAPTDAGGLGTSVSALGIGKNSLAYNNGTAFGATASGWGNGVAIGYNSTGYAQGTSVGYTTDAHSYGTAVGHSSNAYTYGTAVGASADGNTRGISIGYNSDGHDHGTSIGYSSDGYLYSTAIGYQAASGDNASTAEGNGNVFLGYQAGYDIDTSRSWTNKLIISNDDMDALTPLIFGEFNNAYLGINDESPNQTLTVGGTMSLKEQAAANADTAAYGQIWVKDDAPNTLYFTDDTGIDIPLSVRTMGLVLVDSNTYTATGDGINGMIVPASANLLDITAVVCTVHTAGTTGTTDIQLRRRRGVTDVDVLSTKITIDTGETSSTTAVTPAVINTANDDLNEGDLLYWDVDAVSTTAAIGLSCSFDAS